MENKLQKQSQKTFGTEKHTNILINFVEKLLSLNAFQCMLYNVILKKDPQL